jgi:hypothetical protein
VSGSGGRQTTSAKALTRELSAWLGARLLAGKKVSARVALVRADSGAVLLDLAVSKAALATLAEQIAAIAVEAAESGGPQAFALRCYAGKDTFGTKHFVAPAAGAGTSTRPSIDALTLTTTLLGHYQKLVSAQAARLERLEGNPSPQQPSPGGSSLPPERIAPASNGQTNQVAEKLTVLLPIIAQAVATKFGIDVAVPGPDPEREVARALLGSLSEEQLATLLGVLRPEQIAALHALRERFGAGAPAPAEAAPDSSTDSRSDEPGERPQPN